ncbi:hypothetical protein GCM10009868_18180 [Terrabacter aerolatus]|uniref:Uncharacterized protein n=1 Tax=Terrabacter aerolatus TaxID=422442 RepID=A0A512CZR0_9MICO|nr:hypothetical protein TAE01_14990 [Terrabacter aerolatus]
MIRDSSVDKKACCRNKIFVLAPASKRRLCSDPDIFLLRNPSRQINIVGGKVLNYADVRNARWERALTPRRHLVDASELAPFDARTGTLEGRVVALNVADGAHQASGLESVCEELGGGDVGRQRLLDEGVDAGRSERQTDFLVIDGRHGHDAVVDAGSNEVLDAVEHGPAGGRTVRVATGVCDRDEINPLE